MIEYMNCNSSVCNKNNFIVLDGCISEYDEYSEIQCSYCEKIWKENNNGESSEKHQFLW